MKTGFVRSPHLLNELNENAERLFPMVFHYADWIDSKSAKAITAAVKEFYFNNEDLSLKNFNKLIQVIIFVVTSILFVQDFTTIILVCTVLFFMYPALLFFHMRVRGLGRKIWR